MSDEYAPGNKCAGCAELRQALDVAREERDMLLWLSSADRPPAADYKEPGEADALREDNARLRFEWRRDRERLELTDKDYRRVCNELADMKRPEMREGRERRLLEQLGESQAAMLEAQHQMRLANLRMEMQPGYRFADPDERDRQKLAAEQQLRAGYDVYRQEAKTLGCREEVAARAMLTSGPADRTYYERLLDEVNNTKAASVSELRLQVARFLAEATGALAGADLEPPRK
jgi:hypothetical protein